MNVGGRHLHAFTWSWPTATGPAGLLASHSSQFHDVTMPAAPSSLTDVAERMAGNVSRIAEDVAASAQRAVAAARDDDEEDDSVTVRDTRRPAGTRRQPSLAHSLT